MDINDFHINQTFIDKIPNECLEWIAIYGKKLGYPKIVSFKTDDVNQFIIKSNYTINFKDDYKEIFKKLSFKCFMDYLKNHDMFKNDDIIDNLTNHMDMYNYYILNGDIKKVDFLYHAKHKLTEKLKQLTIEYENNNEIIKSEQDFIVKFNIDDILKSIDF